VHLPEGGVGLSASIGVAHGVIGEIDPFELLRRAEVSLRRAQDTGNRQWASTTATATPSSGGTPCWHRPCPARWSSASSARCGGGYLLADGRMLAGVSVQAAWDHPSTAASTTTNASGWPT